MSHVLFQLLFEQHTILLLYLQVLSFRFVVVLPLVSCLSYVASGYSFGLHVSPIFHFYSGKITSILDYHGQHMFPFLNLSLSPFCFFHISAFLSSLYIQEQRHQGPPSPTGSSLCLQARVLVALCRGLIPSPAGSAGVYTCQS